MELSIICPTYNEINFIDELTESLCISDGIEKEILFADGGSTDGTRERIEEWKKKYPFIKMIDNPDRYATPGFNRAYKASVGRYIAFIGAHAIYPKDYFSTALSYLRADECDVVGGPLQQEGKTAMGKAIALVMSSKIGVGDSEFRTVKKKMYVDSVAFAVYKREVFEEAGLLDESLPVNQDDEFHYRINKMNFRILMVPEMKAVYFVRDSLKKLFSQYYKYGLYKPLVLRKVRGSVRLRHLIPAAFVLYLLSFLAGFITPLWFIPLICYFALISIAIFKFEANIQTKLYCYPVFPILHLSYGTGFLLGLFRINK